MLIINGRIFTMEESLIECGFVRTKGNLIEEVGPMSVLSDKKNEKILDVRGAWVMPGLIDSHAHIGITEEKWGIIGDDSNEMTNPSTAALRAIDGINPMDPAFHDAIEAGITSVMAGPGSANVIGGQFVFMKTQGRCIDNMIVKYPAAMKIASGKIQKQPMEIRDNIPPPAWGLLQCFETHCTKPFNINAKKKEENYRRKILNWSHGFLS